MQAIRFNSVLFFAVSVGLAVVPLRTDSKLLSPLLLALLIFLFTIRKEIISTLSKHRLFLALMLQYPLWNMVRLVLSDPQHIGVANSAAGFEMWAFGVLVPIVLLVFFADTHRTQMFITYLAPLSVYLTVFVIGYVYFTSNGCRVKVWNPTIFSGPLMTGTVAFLYLAFRQNIAGVSKLLTVLPIASVIVLSTAFAGARGISLALIAVCGAIIIVFLLQKRFTFAGVLALATLAGLGLGFGIDRVSNCRFSNRMTNTVDVAKTATEVVIPGDKSTVQKAPPQKTPSQKAPSDPKKTESADVKSSDNPASAPSRQDTLTKLSQSSDRSIAGRLMLWTEGSKVVINHLWWGVGAAQDPSAVTKKFKHFHNMYISWMIWGGIPTLLSGLLFLSAVFIANFSARRDSVVIFAALAISGFWGSSMLFDSFLIWGHMYFPFIIYACLAYALTRLPRETF